VSFLVGPVGSLGHPFPNLHDVPIERQIGDHLVYAFGQKWLYTNLKLIPGEDIEAVLLWDPGWCGDGSNGRGYLDEIAKVRTMADEWDCPVFGLASDWFATWGVNGGGMHGMMSAFRALDGVVIDHVGAAALRSTQPTNIKFDHTDYRHREIVELSGFLHAGRLPTMGVEELPEVLPTKEREIDVCIVSNLYQGLVVHRAYFLEMARHICERHGWSFVHRARVAPDEMERLYLNSKVVLNVALGTQANCRVYEAHACGALLVTDGFNADLSGVPGARFTDKQSLEQALLASLRAPQAIQDMGREWAKRHTPEKQWAKVLDALKPAIESTAHARRERAIWQRMMDEKAASAPRTNDGRPVILV
jgi:hypothetical protein